MVRTRSGLDTTPATTASTTTTTTTTTETVTVEKTYTCVRDAVLDVKFDSFTLDDSTKTKMLSLYLNLRTFVYSDGTCTNFSYRDASITVAKYMNPSMTSAELMDPKTYMPYYSILMDYQYEGVGTKEFEKVSKFLDDYFVATTPTLTRIVVD